MGSQKNGKFLYGSNGYGYQVRGASGDLNWLALMTFKYQCDHFYQWCPTERLPLEIVFSKVQCPDESQILFTKWTQKHTRLNCVEPIKLKVSSSYQRHNTNRVLLNYFYRKWCKGTYIVWHKNPRQQAQVKHITAVSKAKNIRTSNGKLSDNDMTKANNWWDQCEWAKLDHCS